MWQSLELSECAILHLRFVIDYISEVWKRALRIEHGPACLPEETCSLAIMLRQTATVVYVQNIDAKTRKDLE